MSTSHILKRNQAPLPRGPLLGGEVGTHNNNELRHSFLTYFPPLVYSQTSCKNTRVPLYSVLQENAPRTLHLLQLLSQPRAKWFERKIQLDDQSRFCGLQLEGSDIPPGGLRQQMIGNNPLQFGQIIEAPGIIIHSTEHEVSSGVGSNSSL